MKVNVLFFGATADLVGSRKLETVVSENSVARDVIEQLRTQYPVLRGRKFLFALNEEYVSDSAPVNGGDEFAIFAPVSGG